MSDKSDFENRNRQSIFKRLGMTELESPGPPADPATEETGTSDVSGNGPCPEHPLGNDLFYVLRNAYRP
ncbi:hypothetical protein [Nisaea nitritireducens]|uniref:hypothetical protein n=1 Tax=Nisaea nitritireducens TaxID=568392 RepID=UPI001868FEAA|nr:hypothetical protein [Nisaea nitritireducens]